MQGLARRAVGGMSVFRCGEKSEASAFAIYPDPGLPFPGGAMKRNALKARRVVCPRPGVQHILGMSHNSQVGSAIVQAVAVNVVDFLPIACAQNGAMKSNSQRRKVAATLRPSGIEGPPLFRCQPVETINQMDVCGVNDRLVPLGKRDKGNVAFNSDWAYPSGHVANSNSLLGAGQGLNTYRPRQSIGAPVNYQATGGRHS